MELGAFSVSLSVKDIHASKAFYEKLGFTVFHGDIEQNWLIMANGSTKIGLFQGMFEQNILTFNPGWDQNAQPVESFTDVRQIHQHLKNEGVEIAKPMGDSATGPESFALFDPDGNTILIDQHV